MVNIFIYAQDNAGVEYYHSNGLRTLEHFKCEVEKIKKEELIHGERPTESKIVYMRWNDDCWEFDEDETITANSSSLKRECGEMCTQPKTLIQYQQLRFNVDKNNRIKLLYMITNGLINSKSSVEWMDSTIVFDEIDGELQRVDLGVGVSSLNCRCMVYYNNKFYGSTDISKEFDYEKINIYNFAAEKDRLKCYIKWKFINEHKQNALQEIDKLKKLRNRLFDELSSKTENSEKVLETKDRNLFLSEFVKTDWYMVEKSISTLMDYIVGDTKFYSFDALKFDVDVNFTPEEEIEFPDVILDDDKGIPVVILTKFDLIDKIIFHKTRRSEQVTHASFSEFKSTIECPLFLVNDQDVSASIGSFYTLNVYKQVLAHNTKTEPITRRPFHGGLVLTDTDQFDKYNDYILSATYFDCKKVNFNVGLFYFVLWKNCENKEWMDINVVEQFKKYAMRRISETVCKIGLSSLPLDPQVNTSLLTALWYCVELSSGIFKHDPQNFKHERLRRFYSVAPYMIDILKYFNYDLDLKSIEKRRELISYVMILKKIHERREKIHYLLQRIFRTADGFLVSEIEKPFNLYILNYLKLNHKEMLRDDVVEERVHLNDYVHLMHFIGRSIYDMDGTLEICEKTFRPFFAIDRNKSFYTELVKNARKVCIANDDDKDKIEVTYEAIDSLDFDRILSLFKLFINCVNKLGKYPTLPEYTEYISKGKKFHGDLVTVFPVSVNFCIEDVYERYQKFVKKVEVSEFLKVCKTSVSRIERIKAEERVKFSNDDEIREFIFSEELDWFVFFH